MWVNLTPKHLENIKNYRYVTNGLTFLETTIFEHFWNFVVSVLPQSLAPNVMTLSGLIFPLGTLVYLLIND